MVVLMTVDFQVPAQIAFPLKPGFFKQADAPSIVWNTGCFDTVQLKPCEDVGYNQLKCGEHMTLTGISLAHPVADHAALCRPAPDVADRNAAEQRHALFVKQKE